MTSWGRIYKFLLATEVIPESDVNHSISDDPIRIVNGSFQWVRKDDEADSEKSKAFIHDINLSIKQGSLTAIVGNVGSGKSSLLSALLGEMECISGKARYFYRARYSLCLPGFCYRSLSTAPLLIVLNKHGFNHLQFRKT
jgi:ABC-type multidrug transport system fused ATPase/permease subunit